MPKQIAIIDLPGFVCALTFWPELAKLRESLHARAGAFILVLLWPLSDGIFYIQRTIVKNLTKTMEIIIDFFFIWKKCDIII